MDQATLASWHDFYVTIGTASASLIGLLFVAMSINVEAVTGASGEDLRAFAEQAFASFSTVLLIAIVFLIPTHDASSIGIAYLVLGAIGGLRMLRRTPAIWRSLRQHRLGPALFWRFVLPAAALLGLAVVGFGFLTAEPSASYWLVTVIIGMLMSAARSSWDLLVKVSQDRQGVSGTTPIATRPTSE